MENLEGGEPVAEQEGAPALAEDDDELAVEPVPVGAARGIEGGEQRGERRPADAAVVDGGAGGGDEILAPGEQRLGAACDGRRVEQAPAGRAKLGEIGEALARELRARALQRRRGGFGIVVADQEKPGLDDDLAQAA
ncbi:MAG: hypothetical protein ACFBQW_02095 [Sphingomonadaceae bacterium]